MDGHQISVNGLQHDADEAGPHTRLLDWLRAKGLTGAKEGCAEGECGACAVMVVRPDGPERSRWTSVNACLPPALAFTGQEIVSAEGLGNGCGPLDDGELHPVQREMVDRGGSQCGYCTPGFVCSMAAEYYRPERGQVPVDAKISASGAAHVANHECGANGFDLHALGGNLCRCTGYRPIRDAAFALTSPEETDPMFRRQLQAAPDAQPTRSTAVGAQFVRPETLEEALGLLKDNPEAKVIAGSTDVGVEVNLRHARPVMTIAIDRLETLRELHIEADCIEIGAALTLTEVERELDGRVPLLAQLFPQFASRLIRNAATFGGNLGTGSPIGDSAPALLAMNASLVLTSEGGEREVALADYFTGYRQSVRQPGELIRAVHLPLPLADRTAFYKVAKRRFDDISSVAVACAMKLDGDRISSFRIGLGGVAATPIRALQTESALEGQRWTREVAQAAAATLSHEGTPIDDLRSSAAYRSAMLGTALLKFHAETDTVCLTTEVPDEIPG